MNQLFTDQVQALTEAHLLVLYWAARAEEYGAKYNITNCFDDLKATQVTRTKQNAVALVETLAALRFIDLRGEGNRRHLYISQHGAKALEVRILKQEFNPKPSAFLEGQKR